MDFIVIKGIIFDFDGVIIDTETPLYNSWLTIYQQHGAHLPLETWAKCLGTSQDMFDPVAHLQEITGLQYNRTRLEKNSQLLSDRVILGQPTLPGVIKTLDVSQTNRLKVGIASSSPSSWVIPHLKRLGILEKFECVITQEMVEKVKPEPDLYIKALDSLQLNPEETIAIEDSPNGITAAQRAGIFCIAIQTPINRHLDVSHADHFLFSLEELDLEGLGPFTL